MTGGDLFTHAGTVGWMTTSDGNRRRVLAHTDELMVVEFAFEKGAVGALHSHPHVQASYVAEGRFEVTIAGRTETLEQGGSFIVPSGLPARRLEEWDKIRDEIGEAIGNDTPDRWLTVVFTTDQEWAE